MPLIALTLPEPFADPLTLAHDVVLASAAVIFADAGAPALFDSLPLVPPQVLQSRKLRSFASKLGAPAFPRFMLRQTMAFALTRGRFTGATRAAYASYLRPSLGVTVRDVEATRERFLSFFTRWVDADAFSSVLFVDGGTVPAAFHDELSELAAFATENLGARSAYDLLTFWIRRDDTVRKSFSDVEKRASRYDQDGGWIETFLEFSSEMAFRLIMESAPELRFPVDRLRGRQHRDDDFAWLNDDFLARAGKATFNVVDHPKGSRVVAAAMEYAAMEQAGVDVDDVPLSFATAGEILKTHQFLVSFTRKHFLGHIAELIALPLVIRSLGEDFATATCIPGTAIDMSSGKQGADAIIGDVHRDGGALVLRVRAIAEVKGYEKSRKDAVPAQLAQHAERLVAERVTLSCSTPDADGRWLARDSRDATTVTIDRVEIADDLRLIGIVPARPGGMDRSSGRYIELQLPWLKEGMRELALAFLRYVVGQCGRRVDSDDDELGIRAWIAATQPLLGDPALAAQDRTSIKELAREVDADQFLVAVALAAKKPKTRKRAGSA